MGACGHCGGQTIYVAEALSEICQECGVLADAAQIVLTLDLNDACQGAGPSEGQSLYRGPQTLRTRTGRVLAGQGKELRAQSLEIEMKQFINGVLSRLGLIGLAPRAELVFRQTMQTRVYNRRQFALVAGAAIAIAIRENGRGETMYQIAALIDYNVADLGRVFTRIASLLHLELPLADPVSVLPLLHAHVFSLLASPPCPISNPLQGYLRAVMTSGSTQHALNLATEIGSLVSRLEVLTHTAAPATSCALLILALEGQLCRPVPKLEELATLVANRVGAPQAATLSRYREICDVVESWMSTIPWLPPPKPGRKQINGKGGQRERVAQGLKDVLSFKDSILRRRFKDTETPLILWPRDLLVEDSLNFNGKRPSMPEEDRLRAESATGCKRQCRRGTAAAVERAAASLLSPLSCSPSQHASVKAEQVRQLQSHILSPSGAPPRPPTRLETLLAVRGSEDRIDDDELFEEAELDAILDLEGSAEKKAEWWDAWVSWENRPVVCKRTSKRPSGSEVAHLRSEVGDQVTMIGEDSEDEKDDKDEEEPYALFDMYVLGGGE